MAPSISLYVMTTRETARQGECVSYTLGFDPYVLAFPESGAGTSSNNDVLTTWTSNNKPPLIIVYSTLE